jgi:cobyrinic acid a,c-diamide synthase
MGPLHRAAILVAAPASGQGKTTVACALARLHARAGRRVRAFKCGPDFLDPHWLELASGAPVHPLDLWMTGEADCRARLHAAAAAADILIVEGVMGLYDGAPSAADLARHFGLPVLAVIDASAMAGTFGALAHGLRHYGDGLRWAGVVANRVAGEAHAAMLRAALRVPEEWLGALPRSGSIALPERHLGLVSALETRDALQRLDAAADLLQAACPALADAATLEQWATRFDAPLPAPAASQPLAGRTIAVARDAAFSFVYAGNVECLQALGARVVFFAPLAGEALPPCDAVWLPGGYPELHAQALSQCDAFAAALRAHVDAGRPLWAECGGMMSLFDTLVTADGQSHRMWGLLPGTVTMQARVAAVGPQELPLAAGVLRGHSFHFSRCDTPLAPALRTRSPLYPGHAGEGLWRRQSLQATYFHAWFPSSPAATASLFLPPEAAS